MSGPPPIPQSRDRYVQVAVNTGRPTFLRFSYSVPVDREIVPGEVVRAPFGRQTLQGIVVDGPFDTPGFDRARVRPLESPVEGAPHVSPERMELAAWLEDYYQAAPWESCALFLPPGAGERSQTLLSRPPGTAGEPEPGALSERQQRLYDALTEQPRELTMVRRQFGTGFSAGAFDAALRVLLRRGLARRDYVLQRPRGRARVAEVVGLAVAAAAARSAGAAIEGRGRPPPWRAIEALLTASGPLPAGRLAELARDPLVVPMLIEEGAAVEADGALTLGGNGDQARALQRRLSRGRVERVAAAILDRLLGAPGPTAPLRELSRELGPETRRAVARLEELGLVTVKEVLERRDPLRDLQVIRRPPVTLIGAQRQAAEPIREAIDRADGSAFLLYGVTGSGKTEVYLDALRHTVEQGRRAIVLVPEIALTPQTVRRFAERFPGRVGVLHSGLTTGEAFDEWHASRDGRYDVVIGSRSAIFAPQPELGLIVVDEAHEWTYKQSDPSPRYDARRVALELARQSGAALVLGTATPSAEQWVDTERGRLQRLDLPHRIRPIAQPDGEPQLWPVEELPQTEVVDMRGSRELLSPQLLDALGDSLDRDEQAILFLNRRGYSAFLLCRHGHSPRCHSCDVALSVHRTPEGGERLLCNQCGRPRRTRTRCEEGGCGEALRPVGAGTQQVEDEVRWHFPAARVVRWDRDSAGTVADHERLLRQFLDDEADVLVGTQMVAKGLDFPRVTTVGVVLADYSLREADFRASERTFQLLVQVAGRAGRGVREERGVGGRDGRVVIQTLQPDHPAIIAAANQDPDDFFEEELRWRAEHAYPPYQRLVRLLFAHTNLRFVAEEAHRLHGEILRRAPSYPNVVVSGPTPPVLGRLRGRHRLQILVFGDRPSELVKSLRPELPLGWTVDVDPMTFG